ncbi:MAG: PAS domain-containing protein, partial [Methanobacteriota archaeon]
SFAVGSFICGDCGHATDVKDDAFAEELLQLEVFHAPCKGTEGKGVMRALREVEGRVERKRADEALRESERKYHALAELSPVGIFRTDAEGDCTYINERWQMIAGITLEEALGKGWVQSLHRDDY